MELAFKNIGELSRILKRRQLSSQEITGAFLERIQRDERGVNAFITVTAELALKQAKLADKALRSGIEVHPLLGVPIAIKDNICTRGIRTTCGSRILGNYIPPYDASVTKRLRKAITIFLGKTNLDEFGMGSSTENSAFGPTRNPVNLEYVAGGSSGGSAAAVAAGYALVGIGTDTGGSIRLPASFCGIVGMKPTYGRISRYGIVAYASSLDQVGCLTRSVEDCALVMETLCGHDSRDSTSVPMPAPRLVQELGKGIRGVRVGVPREYFVEGLDRKVEKLVSSSISALTDSGAVVKSISLPHTPFAVACYYIIATAEASSNLARYDGVKYGFRANRNISDLNSLYERTRSMGFGREVKRRIMLGTYVLSAGYYEAYYNKAQKVRALLKEDFVQAFSQVDCIITPVSPTPPFKIGERSQDPLAMYLADVYTVAVNLAGLPALAVPCGLVEGLPVGLQIIGRPFDEETVLRVGYIHERNMEA